MSVVLCAQLLLPALSSPAVAEQRVIIGKTIVTMEIGQPSVWSLAQAHYFLAQMHKNNASLSTKTPDSNALDPNQADASRLETVQKFFGAEAKFDQALAAKNRAALQTFRDQIERREQARADLAARKADLAKAKADQETLDEKLAALKTEDQLADAARGKAPPTSDDVKRKSDIAVLGVQEAAKKGEVDSLTSEVATLTTAANADVAAPAVSTDIPTDVPTDLPSSDLFKAFATNALNSLTNPRLSASITLDNFVGMQYEIIAKQLSLLRDEVGPDERVIFLELPTSIYTVDKWADDYVAQVKWTVTNYYDQEPDLDIQNEEICKLEQANGAPDMGTCNPSEKGAARDEQKYPITLSMVERQIERQATSYAKRVDARDGALPRPLHVRAIEIIPHQSAINVNESTAAVHGRFFRGMLGLLNGLGLDVVARSQSETYQRFLQQEVFASGFGKGGAEFGWTFGPQPGTNRITPGQRTTYAVLAVPKNTLAIELEARGWTFKRRQSPDDAEPLQKQRFLLGVPGERTEEFFVDGVDYMPVQKGGAVTVLLQGRFFSPQLGVLIDGFPLRRALSITRAGGDEAAGTPSSSGIDGEFEITNSHEIALRFSMGKDFVGTPSITLVSPERSNLINRFSLELNHKGRSPLNQASTREPMFVDILGSELKIDKLEAQAQDALGYVRARLQGTGLLPWAQISINGDDVPVKALDLKRIEQQIRNNPRQEFAVQENTNSYFLYLEDPGDDWRGRYVQPNGRGFDVREFKKSFGHPFAVSVRHYQRDARGRVSRVFLSLAGDNYIEEVQLVEPQNGKCFEPEEDDDGGYQVTCEWATPRSGPEQDFITLRVIGEDDHLVDVDLPVRTRVTRLRNPRTGAPSGYADEQPVLFVEGVGLQGVTGVLFGDQVAKLSSAPGAEVLTVQVPKVEVAQGEQKEVPVILQLKDGRKVLSGATYLFLGAPLPELLLCGPTPCPPRSQKRKP